MNKNEKHNLRDSRHYQNADKKAKVCLQSQKKFFDIPYTSKLFQKQFFEHG